MAEASKKFEFDHNKAEELIQNYGKVQVNPEQKEMINKLSEILYENIGLYHNMVRSFMYIAISQWQKKHGTFAKEIASSDPKTRLDVMLQLAETIKKLLGGLLRKPVQQQDLDKAINDALGVYQAKWMFRE